MENIIVAIILAVASGIGICSTVKHFGRQGGGCCGGCGTFRTKHKRLASVLYRKRFKVEGMHCERCSSRVEEAVNDINGLSGRVDLGKGEVTVSYSTDVDDAVIKAQIERLGYIITDASDSY